MKIIPPPLNKQPQIAAKTIASDTDLKIETGRFIVVFKDQNERRISEQAANEAFQRTDAVVRDLSISRDSLIHKYGYALKGFAAKLTNEQVEQLKNDPRIKHVVQDFKYKAIQYKISEAPAFESAFFAQTTPWGITRVGGALNGSGKTAWVLDTGIDLDHSDLNVNTGSSVSYVSSESADDLNGHGTHVAGIIAAKNNSINVVGVAAGANVVSVKVCNSGGYCYTSDLDAGIDYVASQYSTGDVANISLSWPVSGHPYIDLALSVMEATIEDAADDGLLITVAAGNSSQNANNWSPARVNHSNIYTISAYNNSDVFASFSNYGTSIDYAAPGVDIPSLWKNNGTNTISGTSMAAPHMAGLLLANPSGIITDGYVSSDPDANPDPIAIIDPLEVNITGPTHRDSGQQGTWTANASGGSGGYSYQWYYRNTPSSSWTSAGSNSSNFTHTFFNSTTAAQNSGVKVVVTSGSETEDDIHTVAVSAECADPTQIFCL